MIRKFLFVCVFFAMISSGYSLTTINSLPYTANVAGETYVLGSDLSSSGDGVTITADNITLDCQGYSMTGDGGSGDYGIYIRGAFGSEFQNISVKNCRFDNFYYGIYSYYLDKSSFGNLTINNSGNYGIYFYSSDSNSFDNISVLNSGGNGIYMVSSNSNNLTDSNFLKNGYYGIQMNGGSYNYFDNLNSYGNTNQDFYVSTAGTSNKINNSFFDYIYDPEPLIDISYYNVSHNPDLSVNMSLTITSDSYLSSDSTVTLDGIIIKNNDIKIDCQGHTLIGDGGNGDYGIYSYGDFSNKYSNITIKNCNFDNFYYGIYAYYTEKSLFKNVIINKSTYNGIYIYNSDLNRFENVSIYNSVASGYYTTSSDYNIFTSSIIANNGYYGVYLSGSSYNYFDNFNVYNNNYHDFYTPSAGSSNIINNSYFEYIYDPEPIADISYYNVTHNPDLSANKSLTIVSDSYLSSDSTVTFDGVIIKKNNITLDCQRHTISGDADVSDFGIEIFGSFSNKYNNITLKNCKLDNFYYGLNFQYVENSLFRNIDIKNNIHYGVYLFNSKYNNLENLTIFNSGSKGLYFSSSSYNNFSNGLVVNSTDEDIYIGSSYNLFYLNNFSNSSKIYYSGTNYFSKDVDGEKLGNFWRDFTCSDSTNTTEITLDGIVYTICNSNDYAISSVFDYGPIISSYILPPPPEPVYVSPTPADNLHKSEVANFTINISDSGNTLIDCQVEINSQNYSMTYSNGYCYYTYQIVNLTNQSSYSFKVHYDIDGTWNSLSQRTIYIYPDRDSESKVPGFGMVSMLIAILIVVLGGMLK